MEAAYIAAQAVIARRLDRNRVLEVANELLAAINGNWNKGPDHYDRALEALNALAWVASVVVEAHGESASAFKFYTRLLERNLDVMADCVANERAVMRRPN